MISLPLACRATTYPDREAWLAGRRLTAGASDMAGILGVGYENQSAITVWDSKVNECPQCDVVPAKRLRIGKLMEPTLRLIFTDETGLPVIDPGEFTIYTNDGMPFLGATLDGLAEHPEYGPCPIELKNVSGFAAREWEDGEAPLKYQVQCQCQMAVLGATHCYLLGLLGGNEPVVKLLQRNDRFIDSMLGKLAEFWGYVERREMPPVDASEGTRKLLARLWPDDSGDTVALPPEAVEWDAELTAAKEAIKAAEDRKTLAENRIKAAIKDATWGEVAGVRYSLKSQSRAEYVCKATSFRVLRRMK